MGNTKGQHDVKSKKQGGGGVGRKGDWNEIDDGTVPLDELKEIGS